MKYLDGTRDAAARLLSRPRLAELRAILARPPSAGPMRPHFSANRHPKIDASRPKRKLHAYNTVPFRLRNHYRRCQIVSCLTGLSRRAGV